jgi:hypothetical protein
MDAAAVAPMAVAETRMNTAGLYKLDCLPSFARVVNEKVWCAVEEGDE